MGIEQFNQLGEVGKRPRQTVDLVDHDDVNLPGADIIQQSLQVGTVGGSAGVPAIVIAGPVQGPTRMGLTLDIGRGGIVLGVQRVELLVESVVGRNPRIDRTADRLDQRSLHDRASISLAFIVPTSTISATFGSLAQQTISESGPNCPPVILLVSRAPASILQSTSFLRTWPKNRQNCCLTWHHTRRFEIDVSNGCGKYLRRR